MSDIIKIDHIQQGIGRLIHQWQDKPRVVGLLTSWLENVQQVEEVFDQLLTERSIDTAVGVQLDIIGELVGQKRLVTNGTYLRYFGFKGAPTAAGFNKEPFGIVGQPLLTTRRLDDMEYRLFLKAKAASNGSSGTAEAVVTFFKLLYGQSTTVLVRDSGIAQADIIVGHTFTPEDLLVILADSENNLIPRPAGVTYRIVAAASGGIFGFAANPATSGFNQGGFLRPIATI